MLRDLENGRPAPKALLTHLRHELVHEVLNNLFDDESFRRGVMG